MIHSESRLSSKVLSPEEQRQKQETAEKISFHINNFLDARKRIDDFPAESLLEMTLNLAQMSPEIYTIYNVRRELLKKMLSAFPATDPKRYECLNKELELVSFLLKKQPKSYSLFTHRRWLIEMGLAEEKASGIEATKGLLPKELFFCVKMLEKDERNFHVWNYRNWLISLSNDVHFSLKEESFTRLKVEQNFTNFSALHFRAVNFLRLYEFLMPKCENLNEKKEIVAFGMPLKVIANELEFITTGLYMQANEQGIWQYHRWLIELMMPIYAARVAYFPRQVNTKESVEFLVVLSRKCRNLRSAQLSFVLDGSEIGEEKVTVESLEKDEFSQFWLVKVPKQNSKEIKVSFKNAYRLMEEDENGYQNYCVQDINRKRFLLESEFVFVWQEETQLYDLKNVIRCSPQDLEFRSFALNLIENSTKVVDEIGTLESNNKFVLLEKNYLLEVCFPEGEHNLETNASKTKKIIENLHILQENFKKQSKVFEKQIEIYNQKKAIENSVIMGQKSRNQLISLYESGGRLEQIKSFLAEWGLAFEHLF